MQESSPEAPPVRRQCTETRHDRAKREEVVQRQKGPKEKVLSFDPSQLTIGVVVSRFNQDITEALLEGALQELGRLGVPSSSVTVIRVPGSFELPLAARVFLREHDPDAVVCLGALIQGETDHYQYLAAEVSRGIGQVALDFEVPVSFGVLTAHNLDQARARAGGRHGNKGAEAAAAAMEMIGALRGLEKV